MSTVNREHNFIFIHIPKTAGSSMETVSWMGEFYNKHEPISFYKDLGDLDIDKFYKWAFVRDPYTRFMSALTNHVLKGRYMARLMEESGSERKFITDVIIRRGVFKNAHILKPMHEYLTVDGEMVMDFVGKFENLEHDFRELENKLGVEHQELPHLVKGRYNDYSGLYTPETKEIVGDYYAKDFELFGYKRG